MFMGVCHRNYGWMCQVFAGVFVAICDTPIIIIHVPLDCGFVSDNGGGEYRRNLCTSHHFHASGLHYSRTQD